MGFFVDMPVYVQHRQTFGNPVDRLVREDEKIFVYNGVLDYLAETRVLPPVDGIPSVMVPQQNNNLAVQARAVVSGFLRTGEREVAEENNLILLSNRSVPFPDDVLVHLINIFKRAVGVFYYIGMPKMGIGNNPRIIAEYSKIS
jgi:hypothetical protein